MSFDSLEERLQVRPGIVSSLLMCDVGERYTRVTIGRRRRFVGSASAPQKVREVLAPCEDLRLVQSRIRELISPRLPLHSIAHGYVSGRSIITNAEQHLNANAILNIDLANFFGSISQSVISEHLHDCLIDFSSDEVDAIVALCCHKAVLPQGSPASPIISNLVCYRLDEQLLEMASLFGCRVSRYSDDISLSTTDVHFPIEIAQLRRCGMFVKPRLGKVIKSLIESQGFEINERKLRLHARPSLLRVTGLIVDDRVRVPREFRQNIRAVLSRWERHGIDALPRGARPGTADECRNVLRGRIEYIGQVEGKDNPHYQRLLTSFKTLVARDRSACEID